MSEAERRKSCETNLLVIKFLLLFVRTHTCTRYIHSHGTSSSTMVIAKSNDIINTWKATTAIPLLF